MAFCLLPFTDYLAAALNTRSQDHGVFIGIRQVGVIGQGFVEVVVVYFGFIAIPIFQALGFIVLINKISAQPGKKGEFFRVGGGGCQGQEQAGWQGA